MKEIVRIFIAISIFTFIGLIFENSCRMSMQDKYQKQIEELQEIMKANNDLYKEDLKVNVMPSCLVGQKH